MAVTVHQEPLRLGRELMSRDVRSAEGHIGPVHDVYIDAAAWVVRYLVVDAGGWLTGRRVLLAPRAFAPLGTESTLTVNLTKDQVRQSPVVDTDGDPHLRSLRELQGYRVAATDGGIGHVEDALLSDVSWTVHDLVIDTSNWLGGRRVLVAPDWLTDISCATRQAHVALTRDAVAGAPPFDPSRPWSAADAAALRTHYRRYVDIDQDERGS